MNQSNRILSTVKQELEFSMQAIHFLEESIYVDIIIDIIIYIVIDIDMLEGWKELKRFIWIIRWFLFALAFKLGWKNRW